MPDTERLYLQSIEAGYFTDFHAEVIRIEEEKVVLDRTLFYPLGGGQNWDIGVLEGPMARFMSTRYGVATKFFTPWIKTINSNQEMKFEVQ